MIGGTSRAAASIFAAVLTLPTLTLAHPAADRATVSEIYNGPPQFPDFTGRDRKYRDYRTRIVNGMKSGPNFAGHYSFIIFGCGAGCRSVLFGDNKTGRVHSFPLGGEDNMYLDLKFKKDSRAVLAYWEDNERCMRELLTWTGSDFTRSGADDIGGRQVCSAAYSK